MSPGEPAPGNAWITTTTLLERLAESDNRDAWTRLVSRFRRPIESFALEMGVAPREAEDTTQETLAAFVEAFRRGKYDRSQGRLSSWLFGIAHRQCLAQRRRAARHPAAPAESERPEPIAEAVWERLWDRFLLEKSLDAARREFSAPTFRAFELVALEDATPADAATALGVDIKTIYNAKHRVAKRLREIATDLERIEGATDELPRSE